MHYTPAAFRKDNHGKYDRDLFSCAHDAGDIFDSLDIAASPDYQDNLNRHDVIYIDFSVIDDECKDYASYICSIKDLLREDLHTTYPEVNFRNGGRLKFEPKLGKAPRYTGRILAVGITYDRETKKHGCKIEVLE